MSNLKIHKEKFYRAIQEIVYVEQQVPEDMKKILIKNISTIMTLQRDYEKLLDSLWKEAIKSGKALDKLFLMLDEREYDDE